MSRRAGSVVLLGPFATFAVVLFLVQLVLLRSEHASRADAAPSEASIRAIYQRDCATCHGASGRGTSRGPKLAGVGTALVSYMLSTGRMPISHPTDRLERGAPAYDEATQDGLVRYVASFGPGGPSIPDVALDHADLGDGLQLYALDCAPCHSAAGSGGALLDESAPDLRAATPSQVADAVRGGPSPMPVFGQAALSSQQLDDVVAYVQQLRHPDDRGGFALDRLGPLPEGAVALLVGLGGLVVAAVLIERRRRA